MAYDAETLKQLEADAAEIISRYPQKRSALLPLLHLVQSVDGFVSPDGIQFCSRVLELDPPEVSAVATFYTQYKRKPNGRYTVGVCTNTLCAVMGGDAIFDELSHHLGIGNDETTEDGAITLERVECNAACDYAPVVMVNWEFFDNQTPETMTETVDKLRAGDAVTPTRGADQVVEFKEASRILAGFNDGRASQGPSAGPASLRGLELAREKNWEAPAQPQSASAAADGSAPETGGEHSSAEAPADTGNGERKA